MNKLKKLGIVALSVVTVIGLSGVSPANAQTVSELQAQIQSLLAQLQALQAQQGGGSQTGGGVAVSCDFTRNLYPGDSGPQVKCLQRYLNAAGYTVADSGVGSPGNETEYYGSLTQAAVQEWQDAQGLDYGQWGGYFGPSSQAKYNELKASAPSTGTGSGTVVVPSGTDLVVEEAPDAPGEKILGSGTSFNPVLKVKLSAGSSDVSVNSVTLKKGGFVSNTYISGVDVVDSKGVRHGNVVSSINADNTIDILMSSDPVVVKAGTSETLTFRVNITSGASSGSVNLALKSVTSDASNVDSSYPVTGATMQIVSGSNSIASTTLDLAATSITSDLTVDEDNLQEITRFEIRESSSNEGVELHSLKLYNYGNAADTDYKDVTLKTAAGDVLDVAQPDGQWVTFNMSDDPYVLDKGQTKDFIVEAKVVKGTTKTMQFVVFNDYDIDLRGTDTGVSVIPSVGVNESSFPIGDGINGHIIGSGSLSMSRASDSPSDSVVPGATGVSLAKFNVNPTGEDYELRKVEFYVATSSSGVDLTGTVYVNVNGATVYSTAASNVPNTSDSDSTFTLSYPRLKAGQDNSIEITADISSDATASATYQVKDFGLVQAKRLVTNDFVDPTGTYQGYTIGVSAADLAVTTLNQPVSGSVVAGTNGIELARVELNAGSGGEDVEISDITFTTSGTAADIDSDLANFKLYKDGEQLTTTNSTNQMGTDGQLKFTFSNRVKVSKDTPVTLTLKADVLSGASGGPYTFNVASYSDLTAVGDDTGNTLGSSNISVAGTGQAQSIANAGEIVMTLLSGSGASPSSDQIKNVGSGQEVVFAFKLSSRYEDMKVTSLKLRADTNSNLAGTTLSNIKLHEGSVGNVVDSAPQFDDVDASASSSLTFTDSDNIFSSAVPTTGKKIYVTADIENGGIAVLGDDFTFEHVSSTYKGVSSADTSPVVTGDPAASGRTYIASQDVEITAESPTSPVTKGTGSGVEVAKFKVTNHGSSPIYLATSSLTFADGGSSAGLYALYGSDENGSGSAWNVSTTSAPTTFDTSGLIAANAKIDGGNYRYLTIKTASTSSNNDTYEFSVSSLGDLTYSVHETDLGYDANADGDLADQIDGLYIDGKPTLSTVTASN